MIREGDVLVSSLASLLQKKGIGPTMSKSLNKAELSALTGYLKSTRTPNLELTTLSTLLTAIRLLEKNPDELEWFEQLKRTYQDILDKTLWFIFQKHSHPLYYFIEKIFDNQTLTYEECSNALTLFIQEETPEVLKASFLESLRIRRETLDENRSFLDFFWNVSQHYPVECDCLIELAAPFDGFSRNFNLLPLIAKILAMFGIAVLLHGVESMAPKYGVTVHKLLNIANIATNPFQSLELSKEQLKERNIAYCDQSVYSPVLYAEKMLRQRIIKRPVLATIEKFMSPIFSPKKHIIVTGYTHPPYKNMSKNLLLNHPVAKEFLIIRGLEGSFQLRLDKRAPFLYKSTDRLKEGYLYPEMVGLSKRDSDISYQCFDQKSHQELYQKIKNKDLMFYVDTIIYNVLALIMVLDIPNIDKITYDSILEKIPYILDC